VLPNSDNSETVDSFNTFQLDSLPGSHIQLQSSTHMHTACIFLPCTTDLHGSPEGGIYAVTINRLSCMETQ